MWFWCLGDARFPCDRKSPVNDFFSANLQREKFWKWSPSAFFFLRQASLRCKIASEWRCAILVHSALNCKGRYGTQALWPDFSHRPPPPLRQAPGGNPFKRSRFQVDFGRLWPKLAENGQKKTSKNDQKSTLKSTLKRGAWPERWGGVCGWMVKSQLKQAKRWLLSATTCSRAICQHVGMSQWTCPWWPSAISYEAPTEEHARSPPKGFHHTAQTDLSEVIQEPLPLKPGILVKKSVVLVKRKNGFTKTVLWTENPGKIRTGAF